MTGELASCLRAWRDRLGPSDIGLPAGSSRRAPGLRREEVAAEAGISVNYLTRLEQGRARSPSASVITALCRALRLKPVEAAHLHSLAGHADASSRIAQRAITPSVRRILDRFLDVPVMVIDPAWTIVEANTMAHVMLGTDGERELIGDNSARRQFLGPNWVDRHPDDSERFEREIAGDLHIQLARHPDDPTLNALIADLLAGSERFAQLWAQPPSTGSTASRKTIHHPTVGTFTVDCDHLDVVGSDLRIVLWTAAPGTPDASALKLLSVVGAERFHGAPAN